MRPVLFYLLLALLGGCSQDPTTGTTTVSGQVVAEARRPPVAPAALERLAPGSRS